jgi:hypothetical protein
MKTFAVMIITALSTGCAVGINPELPTSHPGNPQAKQAPVPPFTPMLLTGSQELLLPPSTNGTASGHGPHQSTPSKQRHKPAVHQHHHAPKQEERK